MLKRFLLVTLAMAVGFGVAQLAPRAGAPSWWPDRERDRNVKYFREVLQLVKENYVGDAPASYDDLTRNALDGMLSQLDPHSEFLRADAYQETEEEMTNAFGGVGIQVVYDSVGKSTFDKGLNLLARRGMMVLYGQSSGPVPPFDLQLLNQKGSLFVTRPSLFHYIATRPELEARAAELLGWVADGTLKVRIEREYPLADAARAQEDLAARRTAGKPRAPAPSAPAAPRNERRVSRPVCLMPLLLAPLASDVCGVVPGVEA